MLKKFPARGDWDMLGTVETTPITYREGDTITQAGQTCKCRMAVVRWRARGRALGRVVGKLTRPTRPSRAASVGRRRALRRLHD
jgi:hypothetical protein